MKRRSRLALVAAIFTVFILAAAVSFYLYPEKNSGSASATVLGNTSYGSVVKEGPYGNSSSHVKIAYIVGVHPRESNAHLAVAQSIENQSSSLKYCYYIYRINVTQDAGDYEKGRSNGQLLARSYAVPDIENQKFQLAVDIHSNAGNWQENRFIFTPVAGSTSESIARNITGKIPWLAYYVPPNPTSTAYVTEPLVKSGIPAVLYETYSKESYETTREHADEFVRAVDSLELG